MDLRKEFCGLAGQEGANVSELCRRFGISRKTGYKWLARAKAVDEAHFADRPRRPHGSPTRTSAETEEKLLAVRREHPRWGARKIRRRLLDLGETDLPVVSTITEVLRRHGCLDAAESAKHTPFKRFEHERPNALWQMDFKGHVAMANQARCHPLTVLDDHSRYSLCLAACANEQGQTVQAQLTAAFERYGLPERMTMDNGPPWGDGPGSPFTVLTVWLMRLGIRCGHSRPYHPQTQGKDERFHRTMKAEVLQGRVFKDLPECQAIFDTWRVVYNTERPHQALDFAVPATRYKPSPRPYPGQAPEPQYAPDDIERRVQQGGWFSFQGREWKISQAFAGQRIALRPTAEDGIWDAIFVAQRIAQVNLRDTLCISTPVTHVPEQV
jgi:transposase InsO family protein